jgi:preprotein translocase subunit SecD
VNLRFSLALWAIASSACSPSRQKGTPAPDWRQVPVSLELRLAGSAPGPGLAPAVVYGQSDTLYVQREAPVSNSDFTRVEAVKTMSGKGLVLEVWLTKEGARRLAGLTGRHIGDTFAVLINSVVVSAPLIQDTLGGDTKLPTHIGVPLAPAEAGQLALAVSKTWPPAMGASKQNVDNGGK